jgi:hypothetical protein
LHATGRSRRIASQREAITVHRKAFPFHQTTLRLQRIEAEQIGDQFFI